MEESYEIELEQAVSFDSYLYTGGKVPKDLRDTVVHCIVDSAVTEISPKAFTECTLLSSVQLPDGLEKIGKAAFCNCQSLSAVYLPEGLNEIADYAFSGCSSLSSVHAPQGLANIKIGNLAFSGCKLLSSELQRIMTTNSHVTKRKQAALLEESRRRSSTSTGMYLYKGGTLPKDIRKTVKHIQVDSIVKKIDDKAFKDCVLLTSVDFPNGLEIIGKSAFLKCSSLATVDLPNSLKLIDKFAFFKCSSLTSLDLPEGTKEIGSCAFKDCSSLSSVQFPDGLTDIDESAFQDCSSLFSIDLPNRLKEVRKSSFQNCSSLSSIRFPNGLKEIDARAFNGCSSLATLQLPNGLEEIGQGAFHNCSLLGSVTLPNGLKSIGDNAFKGCSSLATATYPKGLKRIGESSFRACSSLAAVELFSGLETIGEGAFSKCSSLASVVLPDGLETIDEAAFQECSSLYQVRFPKQLNEVGESAFQDCSSLSSIRLPNGLKRIGESAFRGCSSLSMVHLPQGLEVIRENAFWNCSLLSSIQLPNKMKEVHQGVFGKCSSLTSVRLPDELRVIQEGAFEDCSSVSSIQFPYDLQEIGKQAFKGCDSLSYVQLPNKLSTIASGAFEDCSSIATVHFPAGLHLKEIGESAFRGCALLASVKFPDGLETISESAFAKCSALASIQLPQGLKTIDKYAFHKCYSLSALEFPATLRTIRPCAFQGCVSLEALPLPDNLQTIDSGAFQDCASIVQVKIPPGLDKIGVSAFKNCSSLYSVVLPDRLREIGEGVFQDCAALSSIEFPKQLKDIGKYAFQNCSSLSFVRLPDQLTKVQESSFYNCSSLSNIRIPEGVEVIGKSAFGKCSSLTSIQLPSDLQEIGHEAFKDCSALAAVGFPIDLVKIGKSAFESCSSLSAVHLPEGLMMVEEFAFRDCISLSFVHFPKQLGCMLAQDTFLGCTLLAVVALPPRANTIEDAFRNCKSLERTKTKGDKVERLRSRFSELPLHKACYEADPHQIEEHLTEAAARVTDEYYLLPLHILAANPRATESMIRMVADQYPDAITSVGTHGMTPLHYASINHGENVIDFLPNLTKGRTPGQGKLGCSLQNADSRTPTALSILYTRNEAIQRHLFERQPCNKSQFDEEIHGRVQKLNQWYANRITSLSVNPENDGSFSSFETRHGWVKFVTDVVDRKVIADICNFIRRIDKCPKALVRALADAKDDDDRKAFDVAVQDIKSAFFDRLLFLSRFEIKSGPPIHKSETCVVVESFDMKGEEYYKKIFEEHVSKIKSPNGKIRASIVRKKSIKKMVGKRKSFNKYDTEVFEKYFDIHDSNEDGVLSCEEFVSFCKDTLDNGQFRRVAIKFMIDKDQFRREIEYREQHKELVNREAVVEILECYDANTDARFEAAIQTLELSGITEGDTLKNYRHAIVMPCADRNLDSIARSEKPGINKVRSDTNQIAEGMGILHVNGIIHGDLKLQNILRMGEKLLIIDLDASAKRKLSEESNLAPYFVGNKFSSGVLPPEMIHRLVGDEPKTYMDYFAREDKTGWRYKKIRPKKSASEHYYVVKTFDQEAKKVVDHVENKTIEKLYVRAGLPYAPVAATPAIDLWSFGTILYFLCARFPLFKVDVNDDLVDGDVMEKLWQWDDEQKEEALSHIADFPARQLLSRLLSKDPEDRGTIADLLEDPFFNPIHDDTAGSIMDRIDAVEISLHDKMDSVRKSVIRAVYEANEVTHPTTFVILKEPLPGHTKHMNPDEVMVERLDDPIFATNGATVEEDTGEVLEDGATKTDSQAIIPTVEAQPYTESTALVQESINIEELTEACGWFEEVGKMTQGVSNTVPDSFFGGVKRRFNSFVQDDTKSMYLYLIDELTGEPAIGPGYPIRITQPAEVVPRLVPYMQNSVRMLSLYNGAAFVSLMFGIPLPVIPPKIMRRFDDSVNSICAEVSKESSVSQWKILQDTINEENEDETENSEIEFPQGDSMDLSLGMGSAGSPSQHLNVDRSFGGLSTASSHSRRSKQPPQSVRGASLRELTSFFEQHDPQKSFAGLRRIPGNDGVALWTLVPEEQEQHYLEKRHANLLQAAQDNQKGALALRDEGEREHLSRVEEMKVTFDKQTKESQSRVRQKDAQIQQMEAQIRELKNAADNGCACTIM